MKRIAHTLLAAALFSGFFFSACSSRQQADLLLYNGNIYTVNEEFGKAEAFAVKDGKILEVGTTTAIRNKYQATQELDA